MKQELGLDRLELYNYPKDEVDPLNPDAGNTD
jgi:hypothetical protein